MTAPFDTEAYWRAVDRNREWWSFDCGECGATCVGEPEAHVCGEASL